MSKTTIDLKDLDDLLCKYNVKDLEDLESRFKKVADLEAKLAESEEKLKAMETLREMVNEDSKMNFQRYINTLAKNEQLEQQLAEKEKSFKFKICRMCEQEFNQDKIELLEKVKEFCEENCDKCDDIETGAYCGKVIGLDNVLYRGDMSLYEYIDNQIKQLKEMK